QDSNEIQGNIIKIISSENKNLVRVGDINQSITGTFSSSDPKFFKEFINSADFCYRMDMSNRSSKDILDLANTLVKYVTKEFRQEECRHALEDMQIKTV
ncbi:UvrD-helicase domain-containing protein, partial [Faecalibacterium sp. DFI.5.82]